MKTLTDDELSVFLDNLVVGFSARLKRELKYVDTAYVAGDFFDGLFLARLMHEVWENNIFEHYIFSDLIVPPGNFLFYFVKARSYARFEGFIAGDRRLKIPRHQLRSYLAECMWWIRKELKFCDPIDAKFLKAFVMVIKTRGAPDLFFPSGDAIQNEYPLPDNVQITDTHDPDSENFIPIGTFIESLRDTSNQKAFE